MMSAPKSKSALLLALTIVAAASLPAAAGERCTRDRLGDEVCEVGIPSEKLEPITAQQKMSQWCWAASIAMIFGYHGHPVGQERIVAETYGRIVNLPALSGPTMTEALTQRWTDARGRSFRARVRVFDVAAERFEVDDQRIIEELRAERPLLLGTAGHAVVLTALRYRPTPEGPEVIGAIVRDPWPGEGRRELNWDEMEPTYVATVTLPAPSR